MKKDKIKIGKLINQINELNGNVSSITAFDSILLNEDPKEIEYPEGYYYNGKKIVNRKKRESYKVRQRLKTEEEKNDDLNLMENYDYKLEREAYLVDELEFSYQLLEKLFNNFLKSLDSVNKFSKKYNKKLDEFGILYELLVGDKKIEFGQDKIQLNFERFNGETDDYFNVYMSIKNNLDIKKSKYMESLASSYYFYKQEKERNIDLNNELNSIREELNFYQEKPVIKKYIKNNNPQKKI